MFRSSLSPVPVGRQGRYTLTDDFDIDFGVDGWHGTNAFIRFTDQVGARVFRSYFINNGSDEALGSPALMDTGRALVTDFCPPTGFRK